MMMMASKPMMAVVVVPNEFVMLWMMPSAGASATRTMISAWVDSPSSSVTVSVKVQVPAGKFSTVHVGPVKSTSPVFSPSRSVSRWELSHSYTRFSLSLAVSTLSVPEMVKLSPSVKPSSTEISEMTAVGGRFNTLTFIVWWAVAPSSSVTVTVIMRTPRVVQDGSMLVPLSSQSLSFVPSPSTSMFASKSQHTSRLAMSDAVSVTSTDKFSRSLSNTGVFPGSPVTLGGTL